MKKNIYTDIMMAGLLAGSLDIVAACCWFYIQTDRDPSIVLRFIASGAIGPEAMSGGWLMNILGVVFHFIIAYFWTILLFTIFPKISRLNWIALGIIYGAVIWLTMNLIILPLTKIAPRPFNLTQASVGILILMIAVGLPLSFLCSRYYKKQN